eukprot:CAMPEP_0171132694 /NCGR_PEP_ID=MMETSP0766_2-20121228/125015_1 /TAXON_ID=439317 /ORGANISM="Gambierdiscus australes, Strain CAWD 149" /LENGTH=112 /DNA_ID=CAMNT_0011596045 /DNA_START=391 /DNA_END=726 /DNA_ORIENTATION=+
MTTQTTGSSSRHDPPFSRMNWSRSDAAANQASIGKPTVTIVSCRLHKRTERTSDRHILSGASLACALASATDHASNNSSGTAMASSASSSQQLLQGNVSTLCRRAAHLSCGG